MWNAIYGIIMIRGEDKIKFIDVPFSVVLVHVVEEAERVQNQFCHRN
jgi:hypothetical protein